MAPGVSLKPVEVPTALQDGEKFIKWDEDSGAALPVTLRVDGKGFFLYWTDQNTEVELLDITTIRDVRTGQYAKVPKDPKLRSIVTIGDTLSIEDKTVTVCYGTDFVNVSFVNFCCARPELAKLWTEELFALAFNLTQLHCSALRGLEKLHSKLVLRPDKAGRIPVKNVVRVFASGKEDKRRVEKALGEAGLPSGKGDSIAPAAFTFSEFFAVYQSVTGREEVGAVFDELAAGEGVLRAEALAAFLNSEQRDPRLNEILHPYADEARARDLVRAHERDAALAAAGHLGRDGFLRLLLSDDAAPVAPARLDLHDLDQPMAHYFINSSHNTYLTGHQITGRSSVEIYRQALLAGCRCVELDFWNGRTDEPVVVHGYTFVPEVGARDVLEAIAESAFKTSDCPVILSFENHCNPRQQAKIAAYCRELFGDMLLDRPLNSHPLKPDGELPAPSALRRKIIIKNKKKHHHHARAAADEPAGGPGRADASESDESSSESSADEEAAPGPVEPLPPVDGADPPPGRDLEPHETHAGAEISALVNYVQPVHFSSFDNAEKKDRFYEMSSFDEKQALTLLKEQPVEFVNYNKRQLSRVYPAGTRFDSSNFMPQLFWNTGCQLVALNYQTLDLSMQLNLGAFEYSRRCGYLLKPEFMRRKDRRLDPFAESTVDGIIAGALSVCVMSGQLLTDRRAGTYVEVELFGLPADTVRKRFRTRTVPNNGINPVYGDEPFLFKKIVLPELALLRLAAYDDGGRLLGHRVLPVVGLCPGYRHVPLRTEMGLPLPATLLLRITVKDYVPDRLTELAEALANPIKYQSELDRREQQLAALTLGIDTPEGPAAKVPSVPAAAPRRSSPPPAAAPPADPPPPVPQPAEEDELEELLSCRAVKDKRAELARKLDALRRRHAQPSTQNKFYVPNRLVKRLSARSVLEPEPETAAEGLAAAERTLRLQYHHAIYFALEKRLYSAHEQQKKSLQDLLDAEKKEVLARLAASRKEDVRALGKRRDRSKDELTRIKREIYAASVERGVAEVTRLEAAFAARKEALVRRHDRAKDRLAQLRARDLQDLSTN